MLVPRRNANNWKQPRYAPLTPSHRPQIKHFCFFWPLVCLFQHHGKTTEWIQTEFLLLKSFLLNLKTEISFIKIGWIEPQLQLDQKNISTFIYTYILVGNSGFTNLMFINKYSCSFCTISPKDLAWIFTMHWRSSLTREVHKNRNSKGSYEVLKR